MLMVQFRMGPKAADLFTQLIRTRSIGKRDAPSRAESCTREFTIAASSVNAVAVVDVN